MGLSLRTASIASLLASTVVFGSGCGFFRRLAGNDTVDLSKAQVQSMSVDIRKREKTICPRAEVQMAVFADVVLEGDKAPKAFETRDGRSGSNNDRLDFADFAFHSADGSFDGDGFMQPNPDLTRTVAREIEVITAYRRRPDKFTFKMKYKPDYDCVHGGGTSGAMGASGGSGDSGQAGQSGQAGSDRTAGGSGGDGSPGGNGAPGGNGGAGPRVRAFVTFVKTPFYDKLLAVRLEGDARDFLLAPADRPIVISARGGDGGAGGSGGSGGAGGAGGAGNPGGRGGNGAVGGSGGNGGVGGNGGTVELVLDARFRELVTLVKADVAGGAAGSGGSGGAGGNAGQGGTGRAPTGQTTQGGAAGAGGTEGQRGTDGSPGAPGRADVQSGNVAAELSGIAGVTPL